MDPARARLFDAALFPGLTDSLLLTADAGETVGIWLESDRNPTGICGWNLTLGEKEVAREGRDGRLDSRVWGTGLGWRAAAPERKTSAESGCCRVRARIRDATLDAAKQASSAYDKESAEHNWHMACRKCRQSPIFLLLLSPPLFSDHQ